MRVTHALTKALVAVLVGGAAGVGRGAAVGVGQAIVMLIPLFWPYSGASGMLIMPSITQIACAVMLAIIAWGACVYFVGVWLGIRATVLNCCSVFLRNVMGSSPFLSRNEAVVFWGEARVFRYFSAVACCAVGLVLTVVSGSPLLDGVTISVAIAAAWFVATWQMAEWRLLRSRRAGGWGSRRIVK